MGALHRLKSIDFFKKLPSDLTEATLTGAGLSAIATIITVLLLLAELSAFLSVKTDTAMVVDRSTPGELLRINFNIRGPSWPNVEARAAGFKAAFPGCRVAVFRTNFHAVSCEFLTLDVSDALGTKKMNLVKNVRKTALDEAGVRVGAATRDEKMPEPKHDVIDPSVVGGTLPVSEEALRNTMNRFPLVVVNYYAPWCSWCKRLEPAWDALLIWAAEKYPINTDSRIAVVKVDCTQNNQLCRKQQITGFPSIRIYRQGSDDVVVNGHHEHEAYHGDRSLDALKMFIDSIVPSAGDPHARSIHTKRITATAGCNVHGFVMSKKVPGTLHFHTKSEGYSFDHANTNMTHTIHSFSFGTRPTQRKVAALKTLHPGGLTPDWADKLAGRTHVSVREHTTHEHYLQAVLTTVVPRNAPTGLIDAYEYTAQTHTYSSDSIPAAKVSYTLSPIQVMVRELPRPWYHFITTTCAIVGGVFTVLNLLDGVVYQTVNLVKKKIELGKQT